MKAAAGVAAGTALLVAALSSGCATAPAAHKVELGGECVHSIAELPVNAVHTSAAEVKTKIVPRDFADMAKCVEMGDGNKIAAALFRLEDAPSPANLRVVMAEKSGQVLAAAVTTMDESYNVIGRTGFEKFVNRGTTSTVDIVLNDPKVHYVLVSPDAVEVGKSEATYGSVSNTAMVPAGPVMFMITTGKETHGTRNFSDAGFITVVLTPAAARPVMAK